MPFFDRDLIDYLKQHPETASMPHVAEEMLHRLGIKQVLVQGAYLAGGPTLIVSNHQGGLDTLVMWASIRRNDVYLVSLASYGLMGPIVSSRICPIYHGVRTKDHFLAQMYPEYKGFLSDLKLLTPEEIKKRNQKSLKQAAKLIDEGKVVVVFPTGSIGRSVTDQGWKAGVGQIVKQVANPHTRVLWSNINGTDNSDFFRYIHPGWRDTVFYNKKVSVALKSGPHISDINDRWPNLKDIPPQALTNWLAYEYHHHF